MVGRLLIGFAVASSCALAHDKTLGRRVITVKRGPTRDASIVVKWIALDVSTAKGQADANVLVMPGKQRFLIDAGESSPNLLLKELRNHKVASIEKIFVSHPHSDHYNGIFGLLAAKYPIGEVYLNLPTRLGCDREKGWGCDWADVQKLVKALAAKNIPLKSMQPADVFFNEGGVVLETLYAYQGTQSPMGPQELDINDTSILMKLTNGSTRVLFTGDLGSALGEYLAVHGRDLEAEVLKVPHHGTEDVAPNTFFTAVNPKAAIVPSPDFLWKSERSARIRAWFRNNQVPTYVTGTNGAVHLLILDDGFKVVDSF